MKRKSEPSSFNPRKPHAFIAAFLLCAVVAGVGAYFLGMRITHHVIPLKVSPSPYATLSTKFHPPASWKVIKSKFGYQYACPSTWWHPTVGENEPGCYAPGAQYHDGLFLEREDGGKEECESHRKWLLEMFPGLKQKNVTIGRYPAFQLEGKITFYDSYAYDRTTILVARKDTCYFLDIFSRNNPEQWTTLNQILSTFSLTD
jgi:hypothetical protein